MKTYEATLFSGGAAGAESAFGAAAEQNGIEEVNFTFEGHKSERKRGTRVLTGEELQRGDVSLTYVSKILNRRYPDATLIRKVLQTIWYQVNNGQEIYVVGKIMDDGTVRGGTGWGAEFAKLCNKPLFVYDQDQGKWFSWVKDCWVAIDPPTIHHNHFTGTGTRFLEKNGREAIADLFERSFAD